MGITESTNIRFQAVNEGAAIIKCATASDDTYSNIFVCGSSNISFLGVRFEECGPDSSNVFFNDSLDISFESCVFQ